MKRRWLFGAVSGLLVILAVCSVAFAQSGITLLVGGRPVVTDVPPQLVNGRVLVPLRAVSEALGADVAWDDNSRTVSIVPRISPNTQFSGTEADLDLAITAWITSVKTGTDALSHPTDEKRKQAILTDIFWLEYWQKKLCSLNFPDHLRDYQVTTLQHMSEQETVLWLVYDALRNAGYASSSAMLEAGKTIIKRQQHLLQNDPLIKWYEKSHNPRLSPPDLDAQQMSREMFVWMLMNSYRIGELPFKLPPVKSQ